MAAVCEECEYRQGERAGMWLDSGAPRRLAERAGAKERCLEHELEPFHNHYRNDMELDDLDPMPFGKHKGTPMQDVPAGYLNWLWNNGMKDETETKDVARYIQRSMSALKQELPDAIWD